MEANETVVRVRVRVRVRPISVHGSEDACGHLTGEDMRFEEWVDTRLRRGGGAD